MRKLFAVTDKKIVECEMPVKLFRVGNRWGAFLVRMSDHPVLGPPRPNQVTVTSEIQSIDFNSGIMITQNTIYRWSRED